MTVQRKHRILWVTFDFPPRMSSGSFRPVKLYKYLDTSGLEIDFLTPASAGRFRRAVQDHTLLEELSPRPRVFRVPHVVPHDLVLRAADVLRRARGRESSTRTPSAGDGGATPRPRPGVLRSLYARFTMVAYFPDHLFVWGWIAAAVSLALHLTRRYDAVYSTSFPESAHLPGLVLRRIGVPWVVDYRYGGCLWNKRVAGHPKTPTRERVDHWFQKRVLDQADHVVVQSEGIRDDFSRVFSTDIARLEVIPSGYDEADFLDADHAPPPFTKHHRGVDLLHVGALEGVGEAELLELVADLETLEHGLQRQGRSLVVHAVGNDIFGPVERHRGLGFSYRHHGVVPHHRLLPYLVAADCYLLSTVTTGAGHAGVNGFLPSKLWEYLRGGKPILVSGPRNENWTLIDEAQAGIHVGGESDLSVAVATLMARLGAASSPHPSVTRHSWESRAHKLNAVFRNLLAYDEAERTAARESEHRV